MNRALAFLLFLCAPVRAEETAAFLKVGVGARALGMGGAYTAIANDVNAIAWNPAGLSTLSKRELGATHAELTTDTRYDFLGYAQPTKYGTFGAAMAYLSQGAIEGRDDQGKPSGSYKASDSAINLNYAAKISSRFRLGGAVKYIQSSISNYSAQTYAFDFGGQTELRMRGPGVPLLGLAIQNVGPGMKFLDKTSALPLTVATGVGYRLPIGLTLAADFKHRPNGSGSDISAGTEYAVLSGFSMRAGYASSKAISSKTGGTFSALTGFAAGFGLRVFNYSLDYSMTPFGELGNVQRFSLGARF